MEWGRYTVMSAIALGSTCRQIRSEYIPFYLQRATIRLPIRRVQSFLTIIYPADLMKTYACNLNVNLAEKGSRGDVDIDVKWLISFLLERPGINITFFGGEYCSQHALDLQRLLEIARSNRAWRSRIADFECIMLLNYGLDWILDLVLKPEKVEAGWEDDDMCKAHRLLLELGLRKIMTEFEGEQRSSPLSSFNPFKAFYIIVDGEKTGYDGESRSYSFTYW